MKVCEYTSKSKRDVKLQYTNTAILSRENTPKSSILIQNQPMDYYLQWIRSVVVWTIYQSQATMWILIIICSPNHQLSNGLVSEIVIFYSYIHPQFTASWGSKPSWIELCRKVKQTDPVLKTRWENHRTVLWQKAGWRSWLTFTSVGGECWITVANTS